jgi:streptomycin 6-kinase
MSVAPLKTRIEERIQDWKIVVQDTLETPSSFLVFGTCDQHPVVLKVIREPNDEWHCGEVLRAFNGKGTVRVLQNIEGAVLLERLSPGTSLAAMALSGRDEEATAIIAEVIDRMSPSTHSQTSFATVEDWGKGFQRYLISGDEQVDRELVEQGQDIYTELCRSQQAIRLLHGDLQHYNILFDARRGWVAIDPKGVVGELEYELGASLRNPDDASQFAVAQVVERRLKIYEKRLKLNFKRALAWGFAQAVLSAIWTVEDGAEVESRHSAIQLATVIQPMLK